MHVPRAWAKVSADAKFADGRTAPVWAWGWGDDEAGARKVAGERLQRMLERLRRGEPFPGKYEYGNRPLREEILQSIDAAAVVTRNAYGARILNAGRLLFLDIDLPRPGALGRLVQALGGSSPDEKAVSRLREALRNFGKATFRIYRTAFGLRALAVDREFDPAGSEVQGLMQATGTDPAFTRLCLAQRSFRARLTPKPFRCGMPNPPGRHPREDDAVRKSFAAWLSEYERASARYATCRYLETVGSANPKLDLRGLVDLHDQATRCNETLPLA